MNSRNDIIKKNGLVSPILCLAAVSSALLCVAAVSARADWTPPESSVTPPAVLTLDAFTVPDWDWYWFDIAAQVPLVVGPDGALYGSTPEVWELFPVGWGQESIAAYGTLFRLETNGRFTKLHDFSGVDGYGPSAVLVAGPDGALYGSTADGGASGYGTLFRLETNGTLTTLRDFNGTNGSGPNAALVVGPDGALYGSTSRGGTSTNGTLFRFETNGAFTKLHDFNYSDGAYPSAPLIVVADGALYGSTADGGASGYGTLFRVETNSRFTKLHDFNGTDGNGPSTLVLGPDGALYGSTYYGGISDSGTVFRVATDGTFTRLHDFNGNDGEHPSAVLVVGPDGALYGSTPQGGTSWTNDYGYGTLFRVETNGTFTKLQNFNGTDGWGPSALVVGPDGALYGSTQYGGTSWKGTLFRLGTDGTFTKVYDFNATNGAHPSTALVVGADGALYGSTQYRAPSEILFKLVLDRRPMADASATSDLVISPNGVSAEAVLDGSRSSDPDGDTLQYLWLLVAPKLSEGGSTLNFQSSTLLATGVVSFAVLPVGAHTIQLVVNDGMLSATNRVTVEVITTKQAVERLASITHSEAPKPQPLLATLTAALASIERGNAAAAMNQLRAFQNKVQALVAPLDAALAASLVQSAQEILEAIQSGAVGPRGRFTSLVRQANGSVQLQFSGERGGIYMIEASTNLVNWDRIGVATSLTNGQFQFEDAKASQNSRLFYRVQP